MALAIGENGVGLQVSCGGGIAALRALEGTLENEAGLKRLHSDVVAREIRITLGQLPADVHGAVRHLRVFGNSDLAQELVNEIRSRVEPGMHIGANRSRSDRVVSAANEMIITLHSEEVIAMMSPSGRFEQDAASRRMRRFSEWAKERLSAEERLSFEEPVRSGTYRRQCGSNAALTRFDRR